MTRKEIKNWISEEEKAYRYQLDGIKRAEERGAEKRGMTVKEFREWQAKQNRLKTYRAKIERYKKAIEEMQAWIDKVE